MESVSSDLKAEAAIWLARLHADDRTHADEEGFRAWVASSPAHAAAFEAVDKAWTTAGALPRLDRESAPAPAPARLRRRVMMVGLGALVAVGSGATFMRTASAKIYRTEIGEQKHVSLDDGSLVFLDAQTEIAVDFSSKARSVALQYGRANFNVASDTSRLFVVTAAARNIVSNRCTFDVQCEEGRMAVMVIHGLADVEPLSGGGERQSLRSGERLVEAGGVQRRDHPDMAAVLSWQSGFVTFESTELAEAARELNRYSAARLEVDPAVANLKVSGVYRAGDNATFAQSVGKLLSLTVRPQGGGVLLAPEN